MCSGIRPTPPATRVSLSYQAVAAARQSESGNAPPAPIVLNPAAAPPSHRVLRKASTTGEHMAQPQNLGGGGSLVSSPSGSNHSLMFPGISRASSGQQAQQHQQGDTVAGQVDNNSAQPQAPQTAPAPPKQAF